jgi:hypothetical protein
VHSQQWKGPGSQRSAALQFSSFQFSIIFLSYPNRLGFRTIAVPAKTSCTAFLSREVIPHGDGVPISQNIQKTLQRVATEQFVGRGNSLLTDLETSAAIIVVVGITNVLQSRL